MFLLCVLSLGGTRHNARQERTLETIKVMVTDVDQYIKDHGEADRKFIARRYPGNESLKKRDEWEWKEVKYWDEADAFFKDFYGYCRAGVYVRNKSVFYVGTSNWSESGDWYFYVNNYYDDEGRLLHIAADFRSATDGIKVLDFRYFNEDGVVLYHSVEYYDIWPVLRKLQDKPDMEIEIHDIPVYPRISDLPFYPLLKVTASPISY
jgi:hypothetical protein